MAVVVARAAADDGKGRLHRAEESLRGRRSASVMSGDVDVGPKPPLTLIILHHFRLALRLRIAGHEQRMHAVGKTQRDRAVIFLLVIAPAGRKDSEAAVAEVEGIARQRIHRRRVPVGQMLPEDLKDVAFFLVVRQQDRIRAEGLQRADRPIEVVRIIVRRNDIFQMSHALFL